MLPNSSDASFSLSTQQKFDWMCITVFSSIPFQVTETYTMTFNDTAFPLVHTQRKLWHHYSLAISDCNKPLNEWSCTGFVDEEETASYFPVFTVSFYFRVIESFLFKQYMAEVKKKKFFFKKLKKDNCSKRHQP